LCVGSQQILSGSRDATAKVWEEGENNIYEDTRTLAAHTNFLNCIALIDAQPLFPEGAVATGSTDSLIMVWDRRDLSEPALTLVGHSNTVCSLAYSATNNTLLSGSYDGTVRVWQIEGANCLHVVEAHKPSVLSVAALADGSYVSGGADKMIKLWDQQGKLIREISGHTDAVRALLQVDLGLCSAANDGTVRVWTLEGECLRQYVGHESYVYDMALVDGVQEFAACGEDQQVTVWKEGQNVQSIRHPGSVWSVKYRKSPSGHDELVTGCSDGMVRIWTKDPALAVSEAEMAQYEAQIEQMAMEQASSTSQKQNLNGVEYDYVWSVDVGEGQPMLYIGYNRGDDPVDAARQFLYQNRLPEEHLSTIVEFIKKNSGQLQIDMTQGHEAVSVDDPMDVEEPSAPSVPPPMIPQLTPLRFKSLSSLSTMGKKLRALNEGLATPLSQEQMAVLSDLVQTLEQSYSFHVSTIADVHWELFMSLYTWPAGHLFVVSDLLRATLAHPKALSSLAQYNQQTELLEHVYRATFEQPDSAKSVLTGCQAWASLFDGKNTLSSSLLAFASRVLGCFPSILQHGKLLSLKASPTSAATVLLNYAVILPREKGRLELEQEVVMCCQSLLQLLQDPTPRNEESIFRTLVALGTLAYHGEHARTFLQNATLTPVESEGERVTQAFQALQQILTNPK